jgi:hypothetical protein
MEAFAYRYPEGESVEERFLVHRTLFSRDFLEEFGFLIVRTHGRVELCRLELGGLVPLEEGHACEGAAARPGGADAEARGQCDSHERRRRSSGWVARSLRRRSSPRASRRSVHTAPEAGRGALKAHEG